MENEYIEFYNTVKNTGAFAEEMARITAMCEKYGYRNVVDLALAAWQINCEENWNNDSKCYVQDFNNGDNQKCADNISKKVDAYVSIIKAMCEEKA